jgi:hypothetical protein
VLTIHGGPGVSSSVQLIVRLARALQEEAKLAVSLLVSFYLSVCVSLCISASNDPRTDGPPSLKLALQMLALPSPPSVAGCVMTAVTDNPEQVIGITNNCDERFGHN